MSASDAYAEWWEDGVDPVLLVDRLLAAGLRTSLTTQPGMVNVLDDEGNRTPTPVPAFLDLLRGADAPVTYQLWFSDSEDLVMEYAPVGTGGRGLHRTTAYLDAFPPNQFDVVVDAVASMVTDFPGATRAFVLDASNDTAGYDRLPVAQGVPVDAPSVDTVVTRARAGAGSSDRPWALDLPAPGLRSMGWPVDLAPHVRSWYLRSRRAVDQSPPDDPRRL